LYKGEKFGTLVLSLAPRYEVANSDMKNTKFNSSLLSPYLLSWVWTVSWTDCRKWTTVTGKRGTTVPGRHGDAPRVLPHVDGLHVRDVDDDVLHLLLAAHIARVLADVRVRFLGKVLTGFLSLHTGKVHA
jgi:hypothetical protein